MKTYLIPVVALLLLLFGCNQDDFVPSGEGITMKIGGQTALTSDDIDYYDLSTHFIYLKGSNTFLNDVQPRDSFQIFAAGEKIYSGVFHSMYMSSLPLGPSIYTPVIFYEEYVIPVTFSYYYDANGKQNPPVDPRNDPRILQALKLRGQLHEGLKCEIRSVQMIAGSSKVSVELELTNNDSFDYYHLDPEKMGMGLFHYFTNGLSMWSSIQMKRYENHVQHIQPQPWDSWDMSWLSLIRSGQKKTIWIHYTNFDPAPKGQYKLHFSFPGLGHVEKSQLVQQDARIWLGNLDLSQDFQIR